MTTTLQFPALTARQARLTQAPADDALDQRIRFDVLHGAHGSLGAAGLALLDQGGDPQAVLGEMGASYIERSLPTTDATIAALPDDASELRGRVAQEIMLLRAGLMAQRGRLLQSLVRRVGQREEELGDVENTIATPEQRRLDAQVHEIILADLRELVRVTVEQRAMRATLVQGGEDLARRVAQSGAARVEQLRSAVRAGLPLATAVEAEIRAEQQAPLDPSVLANIGSRLGGRTAGAAGRVRH